MISAILYCDACGTANRPQARFCFSCGESLHLDSQPRARLKTPLLGSLTRQLASNHLLKERYRILSQVGKGGFGAVYKAEDTRLGNRLMAVKEMSQSDLSLEEIVQSTRAFKQEALILGSLMHPNLPRIYDHFSDGGRWYLVMDFIEGETLEEHLNRAANVPRGILLTGPRCLPVEEVLDIGIQLCTVLDYLHSQQPPIIFRDLKPANVMLGSHGGLYLIDFGIARHFKSGQATDTMPLGSPGYAAPEQYGKEQTTHSADIYSLGATLHQLLTGADPANTPFQFAPLHLPPPFSELESLITQMVSIDRDKRPPTMAIIKQALQHIASTARQQDAQAGSPTTVTSSLPQPAAPAIPPVGTTLLTYRGHTERVLVAAWSPDGTRIASAGDDETVQVWDASNGKPLVFYRGHVSWVKTIAWSPDGTRIASAGADTTVQVWNATSGRNTLVYRGHPRIVSAVAWSPHGEYIASASFDQTVQVWDAFTGEEVFTYRYHTGFVNALAWSPDALFIASASDDCTVQVWRVVPGKKLFTRRRLYTYRGHSERVLAVAWSPNGARIASGSWDNTAQVWDAVRAEGPSTPGSFAFTQNHHTSWVNGLAWAPNSKHLASASNDYTVQVWEANTGREVFTNRRVHTYYGHLAPVRAVSWSPDGERIASASDDKTVQVWAAI